MAITHLMKEELDEIALSHVNRGYSVDSLNDVRYQLETDFDYWYSRMMMDKFLKENPRWQ